MAVSRTTVDNMPIDLDTIPVSILISTSLSAAVDIQGGKLVAIQMPATWTTANITLQGSADNVTFDNVFDTAGTEVLITAAAARFIHLDVAKFSGLRYIKIRSGTIATPVVQVAQRDLKLVVRPVI